MFEPTAKITLDRERTLRCDINFWILIDEKIGVQKMTDFLDKPAGFSFGESLRVIRAILWAMLLDEDPSLTEQQVGRMLNPSMLGELAACLSGVIQQHSESPADGEGGTKQDGPLASTGSNSGASAGLSLVSPAANSAG